MTSLEDNIPNYASQCNCNTNGSPNCDDGRDDQSIANSFTSKLNEPSLSINLDDTFHPIYDNDNEPNDSHNMFNNEPSHDAPHKSNTHPT